MIDFSTQGIRLQKFLLLISDSTTEALPLILKIHVTLIGNICGEVCF